MATDDRLLDEVSRLRKACAEKDGELGRLREECERMRHRMSKVPCMVYEFEIDEETGNPTMPWCSDASFVIYGKSPQEMYDMNPILEMTHPDDKDRFLESIKISHETMENWRFEVSK